MSLAAAKAVCSRAFFSGACNAYTHGLVCRYAQERAMQQQMAMAVEIGLPLVLYQVLAELGQGLCRATMVRRCGCY